MPDQLDIRTVLSELKSTDNLPFCSAILQRRTTFRGVASMDDTDLKEKNAPTEVNSFPLRVDPADKGDKKRKLLPLEM